MLNLLQHLAVLASFAFPTISALPSLSVKGAKLFADGQQFFIKGVAYQGTPSDPLTNAAQCTSDATLMASIGTNSIRVYHVDPTADHDGCMSAFDSNGIYVWLDLDTFTTQIEQTAPTWTTSQFLNFSDVADAFQKYDNLAGFWIGNEVINTASGSAAAPYVKAAVTDIKSYLSSKNYRAIPIGYSAADIAELRPALQDYLACGSDYSQSIDFYGLNSYEWCGAATYESSGYGNLEAMSEGYSIPIFFSETGCNVGGERTFADQAAIFGPNMVGTWSGAIIYEWVQETNDYGLVTYPNGVIYSGAPIAIQPDFDNLSNEWKSISPSGIAEASYAPSFSPPACPTASGGWLINGNVPLPTLGLAAIQAAKLAQTTTTTASPSPSTTAGSSTTSPDASPSSSVAGTSTALVIGSSTPSPDPSPSPSVAGTSTPLVVGSSSPSPDPSPSTSIAGTSTPLVVGSSSPSSVSSPSSSATGTSTPVVVGSSSPSSVPSPSLSVAGTSTPLVVAPLTSTESSSPGGSSSPTLQTTSDSSTSSSTAAGQNQASGTTTSSSSSATHSNGAGLSFGVPTGMAGGILGLAVVLFG